MIEVSPATGCRRISLSICARTRLGFARQAEAGSWTALNRLAGRPRSPHRAQRFAPPGGTAVRTGGQATGLGRQPGFGKHLHPSLMAFPELAIAQRAQVP